MPLKLFRKNSAKRGDTIIEVSLAFAIFSLVAIVTVSMMNMGLAASERSLELVTARNELNAQAEALRFIHSSYISELTLPACSSELDADVKCQQFAEIWKEITDSSKGAISASEMTIEHPLDACNTVYEHNDELLNQNHAFVINTRQLMGASQDGYSTRGAILWSSGNETIFEEAPLNARIIYTSPSSNGEDDNSANGISSLNDYLHIAKVEGIWVIPVKGVVNGKVQYYDFYIETCWYGSGNKSPTSLDTVIRLYNPEGA